MISFPSNPVDQQVYSYADRFFRYRATPGIWESINDPNAGGVEEAPIDGTPYRRQDATWVSALAGSVAWGNIVGTLTDQTDLVSYIAAQGGGGSGIFVQGTTPAGATEGNLWYNTSTEDISVYREVSPGVFNWVPFILGDTDSDTIDGGNY